MRSVKSSERYMDELVVAATGSHYVPDKPAPDKPSGAKPAATTGGPKPKGQPAGTAAPPPQPKKPPDDFNP